MNLPLTIKTHFKIAILGAGLSGLSAAWFLKKKGLASVLFEASNRPGGAIQTSKEQGFQFEHGPNSLLLNNGDLEDLISGLDLDDEIVEANRHAKKRFIVRDGLSLPIPLSVVSFLTSSLLSTKAKLRFLLEPFQKPCPGNDESLASFAERRFGREILDYLLNPFVSGVYAGTPEKLSARYAFPSLWEMEQTYGSLLKGLLKRPGKKSPRTARRLISFRDGIQTLTKTLARELENQIRLNSPVQTIRQENGQWLINDEPFDAVISTLPLHRFPDFPDLKLKTSNFKLSYAPLGVWHLGFQRSQVRHALDGFGMLVPEVEKKNILGCLFTSTLFSGRVPQDHVLLTVFVGGSRQPDLAGLSEQDSLTLVLKDLQQFLGVQGDPVWTKHLHWDNAIPQYGLEHGSFLKILSDFEEKSPGWFFAGNYRGGVSVPNCVSGGKKSAQAVQDYLLGPGQSTEL